MTYLTKQAAQSVLRVLQGPYTMSMFASLRDLQNAQIKDRKEAIATMQAAIDAPEQEPAWFACDTEGGEFDITFVTTQEEASMAVDCALADDPNIKFEDLVTPLYTAPPSPQAQDLSDVEIDNIWGSVDLDVPPFINFVRAVLAARSAP